MASKIHVVNFGQASGGLTTVGYTIYNINGTVKTARTTTGVVEYGTSTGVYGANINYNQFDQLVVIWDTGGASPRYAVEENRVTLAAIQDETDNIRIIWNTLRNQGEVFKKIFDDLDKIKAIDNKDGRIEGIIEDIKTLVSRETIKLKDIQEALNVHIEAPVVNYTPPAITVNAPEVHITEREVVIPDYSAMFVVIDQSLRNIAADLASVPREFKEYTGEIKMLMDAIQSVKIDIPSAKNDILGDIKESMQSLHDRLSLKINAHEAQTQTIHPTLGALNTEIKNVQKYLKSFESLMKLLDGMEYIKPKIDALANDMNDKNKKIRVEKFSKAMRRM